MRKEVVYKALTRTLWGVVFVGGLTVLGAGVANAADTSGDDGIASGNQIGLLGDAPVTIGGNAISILGDSESSGTMSESAQSPAVAETATTTSGEDAILGGNQVMPDVTAPVTVIGNAISVFGDSSSADATLPNGTPAQAADDTAGSDLGAITSGDDAIAGGNQVMPDATLPIVIGGNSVSVIGDSVIGDSVIGDSTTDGTATSGTTTGESTDGTPATTSGDDGIASGNQVVPDVDAPILVSGNDVAVIRDDGFGEDGLLDGILDDGILDGLLQVGPIFGDDVRQLPVVGESVVDTALTDDSAMSEPIVDGPLVGDVDVSVLSPSEAAVVNDDTAVADDTINTGTSPGLSPLMAIAALSPAMMLAATGVEALPLIGGIALVLGAGIALLSSARMTRAIG